MIKRSIITVLLVLFTVNILDAQNVITGVLVDSTSNERIMFANVGMLRATDSVLVGGAASDENGNFKILHIPDGDYLFSVSAVGYQNIRNKVNVKSNMDLGIIKLKQGATSLDEVEIVEKKPLFANEGEKTLYNVTEDPSVQTGTASDALQNAPGVEVDVEGNISLRGVSSVEIWINDRPSNLTEENLKTYIQQLPANAIEKIEVITNPSARYASKSEGGIINIVTTSKVQKNEFISFGLRASTRPDVSPWASYVWANDKLSINAYVSGGYSGWENTNDGYSMAFKDSDDMMSLDTVRHTKYTSIDESNQYNGNAHLGIDYNIDTMNILSFWGGVWSSFGDSYSESNTYRKEYLEQQGVYEYFETGQENSHYLGGYFGTYYQHKFNNEGHNITFSLEGSLFSYGSEDETHLTYDSLHKYMDINRLSMSGSSDFGYAAGIDYNVPYSKNGEIGLGVAYDKSPDNYYIVFDTLAGDEYVKDEYRSLERLSGTNAYAAYVTLQHKFGNLTIKPGIRAEIEDLYLNINSYENKEAGKTYFNLRPSLHISYRTESMHNFKLSYARRYSNPPSRNMSDYREYDDESFKTGNMDLVPSTTDSYEAGWTKYYEKFGSIGITAYCRSSKNTVNYVSDVAYDDIYFHRYIPYSYPVNVGMSRNLGGEFNVTYRPNAMFNMRLYANVYDYYFKTEYNKVSLEEEQLTYSLRLNLWTKLWNKLEVHASGYYRSPTKSLYAERKASYSINCGLRADFFDRKLSAYINVSDIFNWNKGENLTTNPYYTSYSSYKYNSRAISFGVQMRFGKMELEQQARQGGGESSMMESGK